MKTVRLVLFAACVAGLCASLPAGAATPRPRPFTKQELSRFLPDALSFLKWLKSHDSDAIMKDIQERPANIAEHKSAADLIRTYGWTPERFCYILNHTLIGYKALGIGRDPDALLDRLKRSKMKVRLSFGMKAAEKKEAIAEIDACIADVERTQARFKALPSSEVRLMVWWRQKLLRTLRDVIPLEPVAVPNI